MSSINFGEVNQHQPATEAAEAPSLGSAQPTTGPSIGADRYGIDTLSSGLYGAGMQLMASPGSEKLQRIKEIMEKHIAKMRSDLNPVNKISLVTYERSSHKKLPVAGVIVLQYEHASLPHAGTVYHPIVIPSDGNATTRYENLPNNGGQTEVMVTTDDSLPQTIRAVGEILKELYPASQFRAAQGSVINPVLVSTEDELQLYQILVNAYNSCLYTLISTSAPNWSDLNMKKLELPSSLEVVIQRTKGQPQPRDIFGVPHRRDLNVELRTRPVTAGNGEVVQPGEVIAAASVYSDLLYGPGVMEVKNQWGASIQEHRTFRQRVVITGMENRQGKTLGSHLLALVPIMGLYRPRVALQSLHPVDDSKLGAMDDPGILNIEARLNADPTINAPGERVDVYSNASGLDEYLEKIVFPDIELAQDIILGGQDFIFNSVILKACLATAGSNTQGNDAAVKAYNQLVDTLTTLTNGKFAEKWNRSNQIGYIESVREGGVYQSATGLRSTNDVDTIAVMNRFAESNPDYVRIWSDSQISTNIHISKRMSDMRNCISEVIAPPTWTNRVYRIVYNTAFLEAFFSSVIGLGFKLDIVTPNETRRDQRMGYQGSGLAVGITDSLFNAGGMGVGGFGQPGISNIGRYIF